VWVFVVRIEVVIIKEIVVIKKAVVTGLATIAEQSISNRFCVQSNTIESH
jgi:hypothetical protein